ncbi:TRAM domain-containing protein [Halorarum halobium]|uniref:TRAM domain-containing protein n=1 Tax=Halorarum halobium TaxID=3075121 RepID=UPI0028AB2C24|nr:TRAM domain-containing protein [Halobaculum sp. XH14]
MELSDELKCVFSAELDEAGDTYTVEVPKRELENGVLRPGEVVRVAILSTEQQSTAASERGSDGAQSNGGPGAESDEGRADGAAAGGRDGASGGLEPPVEEGDERTVDIEGIGEQGDGIARVERGFVVIVPDTEEGERVTIEITNVRTNVAFGEVLERKDYYV